MDRSSMLVATEPKLKMVGSWVIVESHKLYTNNRIAQESGTESDSTDIRESKRAKNILDSSCSWGKMVKNE